MQDGERVPVPSVTTVLDTLPKPFLVPWAANKCAEAFRAGLEPGEAYDEEYLNTLAETSRKVHRAIKQEAADKGTAVHQWLEQFFKQGVEGEINDEQVANAVGAARSWLGDHNVEAREVERRVYSREHSFAGTLDKLAYVDGDLAVIDWKSSKQIHTEYYLQTAAYLMARQEETGEEVLKRWVIRLDKETGEPEPKLLGPETLEPHWKAFLAALELYRQLKVVEKLCRVKSA